MWRIQICNTQIEHSDLYPSVVRASNDSDNKSSGGNTSPDAELLKLSDGVSTPAVLQINSSTLSKTQVRKCRNGANQTDLLFYFISTGSQ